MPKNGSTRKAETYANVARISLEVFAALIDDVRAGRQIKG